MRPTNRLLALLAIWCGLGLLASFWPQLEVFWYGGGLLLALVLFVDAAALLGSKAVGVERSLPGRFALGVPAEVELVVRNPNRRPLRVRVFDGVPEAAETGELPWEGTVPGGWMAEVFYPVKLVQRGQLEFGLTHVLTGSPLGLWWQRKIVGGAQMVKVYPNYEPLVRFTLLATENSENQMGIVQKNRIGLSREFHQLREYHEGDVLSQIDWKATSKRLQLISREYEEQRDQNVILAVDCSRRMRTMDGEITQFDHCLNAMLLLAFIALRQGDKVGVMGFGGDPRWFPPTKGAHSMTALLNHLYDYRTSDYPSDFSEVAEQLELRQKRRALVVVLTNIRGEDGGDLLPALRTLRRRHLVVLANLRERELEDNLDEPVSTLKGALGYSATRMYLEERAALFEQLAAHKILSLDTSANKLPVELANQYINIKASGRL